MFTGPAKCVIFMLFWKFCTYSPSSTDTKICFGNYCLHKKRLLKCDDAPIAKHSSGKLKILQFCQIEPHIVEFGTFRFPNSATFNLIKNQHLSRKISMLMLPASLWQVLNNFERRKNYTIQLTINTTATAIEPLKPAARANTWSVKCESSHNGT